jgi:hypothetical protein
MAPEWQQQMQAVETRQDCLARTEGTKACMKAPGQQSDNHKTSTQEADGQQWQHGSLSRRLTGVSPASAISSTSGSNGPHVWLAASRNHSLMMLTVNSLPETTINGL